VFIILHKLNTCKIDIIYIYYSSNYCIFALCHVGGKGREGKGREGKGREGKERKGKEERKREIRCKK